jgi:hypothetical protein
VAAHRGYLHGRWLAQAAPQKRWDWNVQPK